MERLPRPRELALARHRTWGLLGQLVADGVGPELEPVLAALPAFSGLVLPDPDERAAEHQRVFGFEVPPFEGAWRSADGLLGGEVGGRVAALYADCGFRPGRHDLEPEHLGLELALLSHLCLAEHEALADGRPEVADRLVALQRRALGEHLLRWLPAVVSAVRRVSAGLERATVELALELAASHGPDRDPAGPAPLEPEDLLDRPDTGLREIAAWLTTPARAGLLLTQADLASAAAEAGVPAGFDARARRLEALLHGARDLGRLPELAGALGRAVQRARADLEEAAALGVDVERWRARLGGAERVLDAVSSRGRAPRG